VNSLTIARISAATVLALVACVARADDSAAPDSASDGLVLTQKTDTREIWKRPGVSFAQYDRLAILDCPVAFRKNWQEDQNENAASGLGERVTRQDMARIEKSLSDEFRQVFTDELQTKGGYQVVNVGAADVLVLRPAIINLDVAAPDNLTPDVSQAVANAGSMTLYLELYDSVTSTLLVRVVDAQGAHPGFVQVASRVTNKQAADEILRDWADALRKALDQARAAPPATN
jgi:hypothetical protein